MSNMQQAEIHLTMADVCLVCTQVLTDTTLVFDNLCLEHQKLHENGYIALVGVDPDKGLFSNKRVGPDGMYRTGKIAHLKRGTAKDFFGTPSEDIADAVMFVEDIVLDQLHKCIADSLGC